MCSCPLHDNRNGVDVCNCLCQEHDQFFDQGVVLVRQAVRRYQRVAQDEAKGVHNRLNAVNQLYDTVSADLSRLRQEAREVASRVTAIEERLSPPDKAVEEGNSSWQGPVLREDGTVYLPHDDESVTPRPDEEDDVDHYYNATIRMRQRAEAAEERIRLAKDALMSSGYFDEGQVDDDIAPRIRELIDAHNSGFLKMQDDLNRQITKWKDRAVVAERRMSSVRQFVQDNLRVTQDEE